MKQKIRLATLEIPGQICVRDSLYLHAKELMTEELEMLGWQLAISAAYVIREIEMDVHKKHSNMIFHLQFKCMTILLLL